MNHWPRLIATLALSSSPAIAAAAESETAPESLDPKQLERDQVLVGEIILEKQDVFDLSDPKENNALYRLANKLHILTRDSVIRQQLLVEPGQPYSQRLSEETERILRGNNYFYDASIMPQNRRDGVVDLVVRTRDVWTLKPGFSYSRSGGENRSSIKLEELNLFGRGQVLKFEHARNEDRSSNLLSFRDRHLGRSWTQLYLDYADNSDGYWRSATVVRPFFALDSRWSAGVSGTEFDLENTLYQLGERAAEYRHEREFYSAFGGWSAGLADGWVRRYSAGFAYDNNVFSAVPEPRFLQVIPDDRELAYPFFRFELLRDRFETAQNRDQIMRTEDFQTGLSLEATLGWADERFGADRNAALYWLSASKAFGDIAGEAVLMSVDASGRIENGEAVNALLNITTRYYRQQSDQRTFFATLGVTWGEQLDLDNPLELGGDTGLRGFPLRYQSGNSRLLLTIEQRYFWNWYPLRLFRVGGAIFADAGRTWGDNPLGGASLGWLGDVGFGLRLAPTRTGTRSIIHIDVAFPVNGDDSIDSVQIVIESKRSF